MSDGNGLVFPAPRSRGVLSDMVFTQFSGGLLWTSCLTDSALASGTGQRRRQTLPTRLWRGALAHTVGNATEAAYFRSDLFELRRNLMDEWSGFLEGGTN